MSQPFDCACGSATSCLGKIDGAHSIPTAILAKYFVNQHILALKRQQVESDPSLDSESKQQQLQLLQ